MNILQISVHDYGGCAYSLAEAIKSTTSHNAMSVRQSVGSYIKYPVHIVAPQPDDLIGPWNWADVVHVHDILPKLPRGAPPKPTVITYHGSMYRRSPGTYHKYVAERNWLPTVATIDLTLLGGYRWMPDCRPDLSRYVDRPKGRFVVAHAPTSRLVKDTAKVIKSLSKTPGVVLDVIEGVSFEECLMRKGRASVYVDQFRLCYGLNAIEAWQMGMPSVANASEETLEQIKSLVGFLPFVQATTRNLRRIVLKLRDDKQFYREGVERGRECAEKFHSPQAAAAIALRYYEEALSMSKPRRGKATPTRRKGKTWWDQQEDDIPGRDGFVQLRYVGGNVGLMSFTGTVTGYMYQFSADEPVKWVDSRDAAYLLAIKKSKRRGHRVVEERKEFELV